jgi:hypothetical protein
LAHTRSSIEKIRAELAWVREPVNPGLSGCRHLLCCKETGHLAGKCSRKPTETMWSYRQEYFCSECRAYHFGGTRVRGYMTAR